MNKLLAILVLFVLASCTKNGGDTEKPVITLNTPTANQQFNAGQLVNITGTVTDNDEIHHVHVIVTDKTHDAEVLHAEEHADAMTYNFSKSFTAQAATTYKIHIESDDHVGNIAIIDIEVRGL
jgi:hypothetical protein